MTLSDQDNEKLLQQLKTSFKRTINWNKYQSEPTLQTQNRYPNYLIDPSFQGINGLFVLSFESDEHRRSYKRYFLPAVEIKGYNIMIDEIKYENIQKIATGQGDDCTTGCMFLLLYVQLQSRNRLFARL